jgi:hypothetical protein
MWRTRSRTAAAGSPATWASLSSRSPRWRSRAFLSIVYAFHCTDGDGGVPFVARDSAQKDVCGATSNGLVLFVAMAAVAGACGYLASELLARWRAGQRSLLPGLAALAGIVVAPLLVYWLVNLPSDSCSSEQRAEVERWEREGSVGEPPHDCDVY